MSFNLFLFENPSKFFFFYIFSHKLGFLNSFVVRLKVSSVFANYLFCQRIFSRIGLFVLQ